MANWESLIGAKIKAHSDTHTVCKIEDAGKRNSNARRIATMNEKQKNEQNTTEQEADIMNKKKINAFDCICVTDVRIIPIKQIEGLTHTKALAEIVFNDQLLIRGIRVVEGENGLYISYPFPFHPTTGEDGQPRSTVFPITNALRDHVEAVVIEKYQDTVNNEKVTNK